MYNNGYGTLRNFLERVRDHRDTIEITLAAKNVSKAGKGLKR
jgi:hypothetical protein